MIELKVWIPFVAALIPMLIGAVWYNPKVFGRVWMDETGMTEEKAKNSNMILVFGLSYVFSILIGFVLIGTTIHQMGVQSLVLGDDDSVIEVAKQLLGLTKDNYRTFGHGALHGAILSFGVVFSTLATNSLFEQKSWKYILINTGYWMVSISLMGGVVCQFM